jgi:hypothetical protein
MRDGEEGLDKCEGECRRAADIAIREWEALNMVGA